VRLALSHEKYKNGFMSTELVVQLAILIASTIQIAGLVILGTMLRRMGGKMDADDAALFLQGRRVEEVIREMRETLRNR
jgi:hypothetical protein